MTPKITDLKALLTARAEGNVWPAVPEIEKPSPEGKSGIGYGGIRVETYPLRLGLDNRITPIERNTWQVFKALLDKDGYAVPRYEDLRPYLAMSPGKKASKETVARAITILRLARWLTLVTRGRDSVTGRIQGCMYLLHDEPMTVAEVQELDDSYAELVASCMNHPNKSVRVVAEGAKTDINESGGNLPTRLEVVAERVLERPGQAGRMEKNNLGSEAEPSQKNQVRITKTPISDSEPRQKSPSSDSEPSEKPNKTDRVRIPNQGQYSTVLSTNTSTVRTVRNGDQTIELHWPDVLRLPDSDEREILNALTGLTPGVQQMVLDEAASRIAGGGIRNHGGYVLSIIRKAKAGNFKLWAATPRVDATEISYFCSSGTKQSNQHKPAQGSPLYLNDHAAINSNDAIPPPVESSTAELRRGEQVASEVAKQCLDQIRRGIGRLG